jgi:hypothetical protein
MRRIAVGKLAVAFAALLLLATRESRAHFVPFNDQAGAPIDPSSSSTLNYDAATGLFQIETIPIGSDATFGGLPLGSQRSGFIPYPGPTATETMGDFGQNSSAHSAQTNGVKTPAVPEPAALVLALIGAGSLTVVFGRPAVKRSTAHL